MTIFIRIHPDAFSASGPLVSFKESPNPAYPLTGGPAQYPNAPRPIGQTTTPFIATASPMTYTTNIREDGTFPPPIGATGAPSFAENVEHNVVVHISPTTGSTILRGDMVFKSYNAEYDPSYGLNITKNFLEMDDSIFETAIYEDAGFAFRANLQELISLGIIQVLHNGIELTALDIRDFVGSTS